MTFERYVDLIDTIGAQVAEALPSTIQRLDQPTTAWSIVMSDGVGCITADRANDGSTSFASYGFVGTDFRNDPALLLTLNGMTAASFGGAFAIEVLDGPRLAIGFMTRFSSWMFDPNPSDLCQHLFVSAITLASLATATRPTLVATCPTGRPMTADDLAHTLQCALLQKREWSTRLRL